MSRKDQLEQSIAEANDLIHAYQTQLRESESPKAKARARREIAEQREVVVGGSRTIEIERGLWKGVTFEPRRYVGPAALQELAHRALDDGSLRLDPRRQPDSHVEVSMVDGADV